MKRLALFYLAALSACSEGTHWRSEEFSSYYRQPSRRKETSNLERQKILYWQGRAVGERKLLGILERNEIVLEGSRMPREHYVILDAHYEPIGLISAEGKFYRFDGNGRRVLVGEYPIENDPERHMFMTGLKVFFGIPLQEEETALKHYLSLEEIDPYRDF